MNAKLLLPPLLIGGSLLFHWLFWQETAGLNMLLWTLFTIGVIALRNKSVFQSPRALLVMGASLLAACMVVVHYSMVSAIAVLMTTPVLLGFSFNAQYKTLLFPVLGTASELFRLPQRAFSYFNKENGNHEQKLPKLVASIRLWLLPLVVVAIFYWLYLRGNTAFEGLNKAVLIRFDYLLQMLVLNDTKASIAVFVAGLVLTALMLARASSRTFVVIEQGFGERLVRRRKHKQSSLASLGLPAKLLGLKHEFQSATYCLLLLNALLLVVNMLDLGAIWINFDPAAQNLSQLVHEGTWVLIASIVVAMAVVLFIFRGNLNFWQNNLTLRMLAYAWIIQNGLLVLSVAMRNIHYFTAMGLSHKRIGVFVFLLLVLVGLASLAIKIAHKRTTFYLFKVNSWAAFAMLIGLTLVNWDNAIAHYNLSHQSLANIDVAYLRSLSRTTLPLLAEYPEVLSKAHGQPAQNSTNWPWFHLQVQQLFARTEGRGFQSWNYAEHRAMERLRALNITPETIKQNGY